MRCVALLSCTIGTVCILVSPIVHTFKCLNDNRKYSVDVKPNNVFVQWSQTSHGIIIDKVRLGDLEDSAYIPHGNNIRGRQVGNQN